MVVLEAEDVTQSIDSLADVSATIANSLQNAGLSAPISTSLFETKALFLALQEGYVMARKLARAQLRFIRPYALE